MPEPTPSRLTRTPEGLQFTGAILCYMVKGLKTHNLDRLQVTIRAFHTESPQTFHIDTVDLYNSRARESFSESCEKYLSVEQPKVFAELSQLITELDSERVAQRNGSDKTTAIPEMSAEEKKEALEMLKSKDLIKRIIADYEALGYIGENCNKVLGYIAGVSRLQKDPLSLLILSRPSAGKTLFQETVCKFISPEAVIQYTRITGQSLFYREEDALKNKVLAIEEDEGMQNAMYSVKTLISSQKLSIATTRTDPKTGKLSVDEYIVTGPVVVFVSTTKPEGLDDETKRRFLILTIDETPEQTKQIQKAQRMKNSPTWYAMTAEETTITKLHHNMQRLLKPITVAIPDDLTINFPTGRLQLRGEQAKFYSLVKAITMLHQYQRKNGTINRIDKTTMPCIYATQQDVDLAFELGKPVFIRNIDDVSPTGRILLKEIDKLTRSKYEDMKKFTKIELTISEVPFTRKELREAIGWSETQIRVNIEPLVELGYLGRLAGKHGSACRYVMVDNGEDDPLISFEEAKK